MHDDEDGYFDEPVAATYDETTAELFDPAVVEPTVDFLAELAGTGRALELGIARHSDATFAERRDFGGLPYFPVDEALRFELLALEPYAGKEPTSFQIPTSDGKLKPAERAGTFHFDVQGVPCSLTAYTFEGNSAESVFVPFLDRTSGKESYGAGRYLDLDRDGDGTYTIDFNLAYHPSCVYDIKFSCPLTPAENRLPVRIEAGERLASTA